MIIRNHKVSKNQYECEFRKSCEDNVYLKPLVFSVENPEDFEKTFIAVLRKSNYSHVRVHKYVCGKKVLSIYTLKGLTVMCEQMGQVLVMRMDRRASSQYRIILYESIKSSDQNLDGSQDFADFLTVEQAKDLIEHGVYFIRD